MRRMHCRPAIEGAIAVLLAVVAGNAQADLVFHQGFETCWSAAIAPATFFDRLSPPALDGAQTCIPQQSGSTSGVTYTACDTAACAGGAVGCPLTLHLGSAMGDFVTGQFSVAGTADDIAVPLTISGFGAPITCSRTVSAIAVTMAPDYQMQADGPNGTYTNALLSSPVTLNSYAVGAGCGAFDPIMDLYFPTLVTQAQNQASASAFAALSPETVDVSICPLVP